MDSATSSGARQGGRTAADAVPEAGSAPRVLVLLRDGAARDGLRRLLAAAGRELVPLFADGDGTASVKAQRPSLVLADTEHATATAGGALRALRDVDDALPVVVLIAPEERSLRAQLLEEGAFEVLEQPLEPETLQGALGRALRHDRLVRESRAVQARLEAANRRLEGHLSALELDQRAGRRVQFGMLPPSPMAIGSCRLQHRVFPSQHLSGDFVDYFELTPELFVFYVADVAGHGASSAFVTVLLKNFSRRLRREYRPAWLEQPGAILDWLNRELLEMDLDKHVALFLGLVERDAGRLYWANAGQFPPPLVATAAGVEALEMRAPPLGLFPDQAYASHDLELAPPFVLLACTDGILELFPGLTLEEKERQLRAALTPSTKDIAAYLEALALEEPQAAPDDVALMLLTCRTASGRPDSRH